LALWSYAARSLSQLDVNSALASSRLGTRLNYLAAFSFLSARRS
jgi:hypothetical protein